MRICDLTYYLAEDMQIVIHESNDIRGELYRIYEGDVEDIPDRIASRFIHASESIEIVNGVLVVDISKTVGMMMREAQTGRED